MKNHGDGQNHHGEDVARDEEILGSRPGVQGTWRSW